MQAKWLLSITAITITTTTKELSWDWIAYPLKNYSYYTVIKFK